MASNTRDPFLAATLSSIAAVGYHAPTAELARDVDRLTAQPLIWYREYVHWPTGMGAHGIPVEVSVSMKESGRAVLRLLSDLQDHRFQLAGNWHNYVTAAARVTRLSEASASQLMAKHMDIDPPNTKTPIYFGQRYEKRRHSSLYFSTVSWPRQLICERIPECATIPELKRSGHNAPWVHLAGYDFDEAGSIYRTKLYAWLDRDSPLRRVSDAVPDAPSAIAQELLDHLTKVHRIETPHDSSLLQFSYAVNGHSWARKLYLHAPKWDFDNPAGLGSLVRYITERWGADVKKLMEVLSIFSEHGVPLLPSGLAFGLSERVPPAFTFYFAPVLEKPTQPSSARLRSIYRKSIRAILQQARLGWPGIQARDRMAAISRIRLALASQSALRAQLAGMEVPTIYACEDDRAEMSELTIRTREALISLRLGTPMKDTLGTPLAIARSRRHGDGMPPELTALRLLARLESKRYTESEALQEIDSLICQERWGGGWVGPGGELDVTVTVLEALTKASVDQPSLASYLAPVLRRTIYWLRAIPVPKEPSHVALWMKGNLLTGDTRSSQSLRRGVEFLAISQNEDGTWLPSPFESASGDCAYLDAHGWLTTALASESLACLL